MRTALLALGALEFFLFAVTLVAGPGMPEESRRGTWALGYVVGVAMAVLVYVRFA